MDTRQLLADKAKEYVNAIKAFDFSDIEALLNSTKFLHWQDLMKALPHIKIREGYILDAYYSGDAYYSKGVMTAGTAAILKLYAAKKGSQDRYQPVPESQLYLFDRSGYDEEKEAMKKKAIRPFVDGQYIDGTIPWQADETIPRLENYLEFDFSPIAIWEALLLLKVTSLYLPHFWHAASGRGLLVVDDSSLVEACTGRYTHGVNYKSLLGNQRMLLPMVEVKSSCLAYASYCYWNDWEGLSCVTFEVTNKEGEICYNQIDEKILIEYNCRVMF